MMRATGLNAIIVLAVLICVFTIYYFKKNKQHNVGLFILIIYSVTSISSLFYYALFGFEMGYNHIHFTPFIYWLIIFYISFLPLQSFDNKKISSINFNIRLINMIGIFGLIISIGPIIETLLKINSYYSNFSDLYSSAAEMHDDQSYNLVLSDFSKICMKFVSWLKDVSFLLIFPLIVSKQRKKVALIGVILVIVANNISNLITVSRGASYVLLLSLCGSFLLYEFMVEKKIKKIVFRYGSIAVLSILLLFSIITLGRTESTQEISKNFTLEYFMLRYMGESFLNYDEYVFKANGTTNGDMTMYYPKKILGLEVDDVDRKWFQRQEPKVNIPMNIFYTHIGDCVIDIGPLFAAIFLISISFFLLWYIQSSGSKWYLSNLIPIFIYVKLMAMGSIGYIFKGSVSQVLIADLVIYIIMRYYETRNKTPIL